MLDTIIHIFCVIIANLFIWGLIIGLILIFIKMIKEMVFDKD